MNFVHSLVVPAVASLVGVVGLLTLSADAYSCSIIEVTPATIAEKMRADVAELIGYEEGELPSDAIVTPVLYTPVGLGADCSGLHTWYWHSHFDFDDVNPPVGFHCTIRGQIVVLGYTAEGSPVAKRYSRHCSTIRT